VVGDELATLQKIRVSRNEHASIDAKSQSGAKLTIKLQKSKAEKVVAVKANDLKASYDRLNNLYNKQKDYYEKTDCIVGEKSDNLNKEQSRNTLMTKELNKTNNKRDKSTENAFALVEYSNALKEKWRDVSTTIKMFETTIEELRKGNDTKTYEYTKQQGELENANLRFEHKICKFGKFSKEKEKRIKELEIRRECIMKEIEEERKVFLEKENREEIKRSEIDGKLTEMMKSYYDLHSSLEVKRSKISQTQKYIEKKEKGREEIEMKINELMCKNDLLRQEIKDLTIKLEKPPSANFSLKKNKSMSQFSKFYY